MRIDSSLRVHVYLSSARQHRKHLTQDGLCKFVNPRPVLSKDAALAVSAVGDGRGRRGAREGEERERRVEGGEGKRAGRGAAAGFAGWLTGKVMMSRSEEWTSCLIRVPALESTLSLAASEAAHAHTRTQTQLLEVEVNVEVEVLDFGLSDEAFVEGLRALLRAESELLKTVEVEVEAATEGRGAEERGKGEGVAPCSCAGTRAGSGGDERASGILHPIPYTINPTGVRLAAASTLNSIPCTLTPETQTLNTKGAVRARALGAASDQRKLALHLFASCALAGGNLAQLAGQTDKQAAPRNPDP
jgi:hypothetical protein